MCGTDPGGYVAEGPGLSVYALSDGTVYRTYVTTTRGSSRPWPTTGCWTAPRRVATRAQRSPLWIRRHDEYEDYNAQIIREFRANEGRVGGMWEETPLLLLSHTGARIR